MPFWGIFLLFISVSASAECLPPVSRSELSNLITEVKRESFPELLGLKIPLVDYKSKNYFFQASLSKKALLSGKKRYFLEVNPLLLSCPPSTEGLRAIIAHELAHFRDYETLSVTGLTKLGAHYLASQKFRRNYERQTDMAALDLGHGPGLIEYRLWLYEKLSPKSLARKKRIYLTPEEIKEQM